MKKQEANENLFEGQRVIENPVPEPDCDNFYRSKGYAIIAGVDEAGRGALAGPVCAASVILGKVEIEGLADSKKLTAKIRSELYESILQNAEAVGIAMAGDGEIDRSNILAATLHAMALSVNSLLVKPDLVLVDGNALPGWNYESVAIVKGDSKSKSIMAASIVAKVTRDRFMSGISRDFPGWGFEIHKGYGVKAHMEMILAKGPTHIHRKTFFPCSEMNNVPSGVLPDLFQMSKIGSCENRGCDHG